MEMFVFIMEQLISIDTNQVEFSGYQTINFKDGKISAIWEWGGL